MQTTTVALDAPLPDIRAIGALGCSWADGHRVIVGLGEAVRIEVDRAAGVDGAARAQKELAALGDADSGGDADGEHPHGPVAFGAFDFAMSTPGSLVVPEIVLVEERGRQWLTVVDGVTASDAVERLTAAGAAAVAEVAALRAQFGREPSVVESAIEPAVWRDEIVAGVIARIRSGALTKAVLAREAIVRASQPISVAGVLDQLHRTHAAAQVFSVDGFVGASPELLVARAGDVVLAHPLAGTAPRHTDPAADAAEAKALLESTKNQWEHRITIEWFLDELLPFCSYVDAEPEPTIVSLPNVHHLGTRVEGRLSRPPASVLELVAALHPTPAVGGKPQADALALIESVERADRGRYGGPVGWVDGAGNGAFAVGIRSAQIDGASARLFAGVGVVGDSDPAAELAETEAKFRAMLPPLLAN